MTLEICSVILHNICVGGLIYTYIYMRNSAHIMVVTTPTETDKDKNTKILFSNVSSLQVSGSSCFQFLLWELLLNVQNQHGRLR